MSKLRIQLAAAVLVAGFAAQADAASLVTFGDPWGQKSTIDQAMDEAFGAGLWDDLASPADSGFLAGETFAYLEGGDDTTNDLEDFLTAHATSILNWVSGGGRLFINAAPNVGNGLTFGGLTLNYPAAQQTFCDNNCTAVDPTDPIFTGIRTTDFRGTSFSHGTVTGGAIDYIVNGFGESLLSSIDIGLGSIFMGTMTTTNFHYFKGKDAVALRSNILEYAATGAVTQPPAVPLPAAGWLMLAGFGGLAAMARRKKAA